MPVNENTKYLLVSYSTFRIAMLIGSVYYVVQPSGYFSFCTTNGQIYSCNIDNLTDISDFDANFKPTAIEAPSPSDALALSQLNNLVDSSPKTSNFNYSFIHPTKIISESGSYTCITCQGVLAEFIINILGPITGVNPSITYTLQEVDPGDKNTAIGDPKIIGPINTIGITKTSIFLKNSSTLKVFWTVTGTSPVFNNIHASLFSKISGHNFIQGENSDGQPNINPILIAGTDGYNIRNIQLHDLDNDNESEYNIGVSLRLPGSGGSVVGGTSINPIRIDPIGTTIQPISATSLPLPTGSATESTLATRLSESTFTSRMPTIGQKTMANSSPVVLAVDQGAIPVNILSGGDTVNKVAYDISDTTIYIGTAPLGTLTSLPLWLIKRVTLVGGEPTFTEWSLATAIWDNRTSTTYT